MRKSSCCSIPPLIYVWINNANMTLITLKAPANRKLTNVCSRALKTSRAIRDLKSFCGTIKPVSVKQENDPLKWIRTYMCVSLVFIHLMWHLLIGFCISLNIATTFLLKWCSPVQPDIIITWLLSCPLDGRLALHPIYSSLAKRRNNITLFFKMLLQYLSQYKMKYSKQMRMLIINKPLIDIKNTRNMHPV